MSTSYKTLWQEVTKENALLKEQLRQERAERRQEVDKLLGFITSHRSDLAQTRPILDLAGIARHMKVARFTPQQWAQRDLLPPVDFPEIREPLWYAATIREKFAEATGRVWYDNPDEPGLSPAA
jgi:hypothetical protein